MATSNSDVWHIRNEMITPARLMVSFTRVQNGFHTTSEFPCIERPSDQSLMGQHTSWRCFIGRNKCFLETSQQTDMRCFSIIYPLPPGPPHSTIISAMKTPTPPALPSKSPVHLTARKDVLIESQNSTLKRKFWRWTFGPHVVVIKLVLKLKTACLTSQISG